ncbi:MAG: zf-HC2 domain-containing protein [candidate division Zixibacteria bacterium]|nr:zf-HC2 domain-containing protein [candidate division Zixibacteria bacterium]
MPTMTDESLHQDACPPEIVCSTYADGELAGSEARAFTAHLQNCPRCQGLVQAFRRERDTLFEVIGNAEAFLAETQPAPVSAPSPIHILKLLGLVIGLAALMRLGIGWVMGLELPWSIEWLNPLNVSGQLSMLFSTGAYFIEYYQNGGTTMVTLISDVGLAVAFIMLLATLYLLLRRPAGTLVVLGGLLLMLGHARPAEAIEIRSGESVSVDIGEIIDDTLIASGRVVRIDGEVTGDLIVFAQSIEIAGSVHGDIFSFGRTIEVDGRAGGGFAGFGQVIRIGDAIGQSVYGFAQSLRSSPDATIEGDLFAFGENIYVGGSVGRNVTVFGNTLTISGEVERDVTFGGRLATVQSSAAIGGNLDVGLPDEASLDIDSNATVAGETIVEVPEPGEDADEDGILSVWTIAWTALWLVTAFLSGLLLLWALPALRRVPLDNLNGILTSAGFGFVLVTATPVLAVVLAVTLIGLPAGLVIAAVWALSLYVSKIVVAHFLGNALLRPKQQDVRSMLLPLLAGLVLVLIAVSLPYVGWVINLLLVIIGLGAMGQALYRSAGNRAAAA